MLKDNYAKRRALLASSDLGWNLLALVIRFRRSQSSVNLWQRMQLMIVFNALKHPAVISAVAC